MVEIKFETGNSSQSPAKNNNGCFKAIIGVAIFFLFVWMINKCSDDKKDVANTTNSIMVNDSVLSVTQNLKSQETARIDSAKIKDLKKYFIEKKDEFEPYSWVKPKSKPLYINTNGFYCYFQKNDDGTVSNLRFVGQYAADDWLFIKNIKFNIDGKTYSFTPSEIKTDHDTEIWEWFDEQVDVYNSDIVEAISKAKSVKVRFNGQQYYKDKTMSQDNIKSIKRTIEYYKALNGTY